MKVSIRRRKPLMPMPGDLPGFRKLNVEIIVTAPVGTPYETACLELVRAFDEALDELRVNYAPEREACT